MLETQDGMWEDVCEIFSDMYILKGYHYLCLTRSPETKVI